MTDRSVPSLRLRVVRSWIAFLVVAMTPVVVLAQDAAQHFTFHDKPRALPDIRFENEQGQPVTLASFMGKVVLLNVWATWCGPCRREMPTLDRLQAQLGGPDFEVVALSMDRAGIKVIRPFYKEVGIAHLAMYVDSSGKVAQALGVGAVPMTMLIDRKGQELGRLAGAAEWDSPAMITLLRSHLARKTGADLSGPPRGTPTAQLDRTCYAIGSLQPGRCHQVAALTLE